MATCLICEKPLINNIFHLRPIEIQRMAVLSRVRMDKKHVKFESTSQLQLHENCFDFYSSWKEAVRNRENFEKMAQLHSEQEETDIIKQRCI